MIILFISIKNNLLNNDTSTLIINNNLKANKYNQRIKLFQTKDDINNKINNNINNKIKLIESKALLNKTQNKKNNTLDNVKIKLFYNVSCPHSQTFLPTWKLIKDSIQSNVKTEEYECTVNKDVCVREKITVVPSLIIYTQSGKHKIEGVRSYDDIKNELSTHNIILKEYFQNYISALQVEGDERKTDDPDCPFISFYEADKNYYCADSRSIKGCINATPGSGIHPYDAAYGLVGGYLLGLPKKDQKTISKCAKKHKDIIRGLNLCNTQQLSEKAKYHSRVKDYRAKSRFNEVDYEDNIKISNGISSACLG